MYRIKYNNKYLSKVTCGLNNAVTLTDKNDMNVVVFSLEEAKIVIDSLPDTIDNQTVNKSQFTVTR